MTTTDERQTIGERYSAATESSHLKLGERRGDIDLIIAAGLVPDGLASTLFRLQVEYDGVRAEHISAETRMRSLEKMAPNEVGEHDETGETAAERTAKILQQAEREALTAHVLILSQLTSLRDAKQLFGAFASVEATRRRFMKPDRDVAIIAGRVLEVFLAPNCRHCHGRGFNGGATRDEPTIPCRPCRGSGHRRDSIGKDDAERRFAGHLLMTIDARMFEVQKSIRANMNQVEAAKVAISEASAA